MFLRVCVLGYAPCMADTVSALGAALMFLAYLVCSLWTAPTYAYGFLCLQLRHFLAVFSLEVPES